MDDSDLLLEDLKFDADAELEGFFAGKTPQMVNLQPLPEHGLGSSEGSSTAASSSSEGGGAAAGTGTGGAAAAAGVAGAAAAATAAVAGLASMVIGKSALPPMVNSVMEKAVPSMLQPSAEKAGAFLKKAQPWKDFLLPLSIPAASEGCSRLTANIYNFQTNYAILFTAQLMLAILVQPSALICIIITVVIWVFFLKKNDDPEWAPAINGAQLGPMQRLLLMAASTVIVLLFMVGGIIVNTCFFYLVLAFAHGVLHDPSTLGMPGGKEGSLPL